MADALATAAGPRQDVLRRFGRPSERSWATAIRRVCTSLAVGARSNVYIDLLASGRFVPAGQIWRGAGVRDAVLYNCFVTAPHVGETLRDLAHRITSWTARGCGVGVNVSPLIRAGEDLSSVVRTIAASQQNLWRSGVSRTATMVNIDFGTPGTANVATTVGKYNRYRHVNLGVVTTDSSLDAASRAISGGDPTPEADELLSLAQAAWMTGNPGLLFFDRINADHQFVTKVFTCNPCAEQHLEPEEGCNLGSLNLHRFVRRNTFDDVAFDEAVRLAVAFLDAVCDISAFPSTQSERITRARRRIGLGVMGFATALNTMGIPYSSPDALALASQIGKRLASSAERESARLVGSRGAAVGLDQLTPRRRNSHLTSIAPTGAISLIWNVSSGIEPPPSREFRKEDGTEVVFGYGDKWAAEIPWRHQVEVTAAWQESIDGGISKTVILPQSATVRDVLDVFLYAWRRGCKSISVFRVGSRKSALTVI